MKFVPLIFPYTNPSIEPHTELALEFPAVDSSPPMDTHAEEYLLENPSQLQTGESSSISLDEPTTDSSSVPNESYVPPPRRSSRVVQQPYWMKDYV